MTNQEAVTKLTNIVHDDHYAWHPSILTAFGMAVDALKGTDVDCISRAEAIDAIESHIRTAEEPYHLSRVEEVMNHVFEIAASCVYNLPSAQPEPCEDAVSREAISEWLKQYGQDVLHGKYKFSLMYIWKNLMDLPSAQPETAKRIVGKSRGGMTLWYQCDMCNEPVDVQDNYCRGCGRRLVNE